MKRLFVREQAQAAYAPRCIRIGVTGLGRGAGATLIASSLALFFAEQGRAVSYTECPASFGRGGLYESAGFEYRFTGRGFLDVPRLCAEDGNPHVTGNREMGVVWVLGTPADRAEPPVLTERQMARYLRAGAAEWEICDMELGEGSPWRPFVTDLDALIAVVDPLPSKLQGQEETRRFLKAQEARLAAQHPGSSRFFWVVNFMNPSVGKREILSWLPARSALWADLLDPALFYEDEYRCRFHFENPEIRRMVEPILRKLANGENFT